MMKIQKWLTKISRNFVTKNKGIVILVPTIVLSGLILVISVGLSQVLVRELEFSADLLFSEKAYFAAESGVEKALLELKKEPLNLIKNEEKEISASTDYVLSIANSVEDFEFDLDSFETIKFQLGVDSDPELYVKLQALKDIEVTPKNEDLQWKILCQKDDFGKLKTISLQGRTDDIAQGNYDSGAAIVDLNYNLVNFLTNNAPDKLCFMSLTNLGEDFISDITISSKNQNIAPARVGIRAEGRSFSREKIVTFEYLQKNLDAVFDFGLYFIPLSP